MREHKGSGKTLDDSTVQKKLRCFDKAFKNYRQKLSQYYGEDTSNQIAARTRKEYEALLPQTPKFAGTANIFNWAIAENVMIVAFYKSMKAHGKTANESIRILFALTEDSYDSMPTILRRLARKIVFSQVFFWIVRRSAEKVRNHPDGWNIDYNKGDGKTSDWYFECNECGVIKYYKKHGAEELAPYCNFIDYIQSRIIGMGMQNPKNIGQGDKICCEYMKAGRETVVPDNLRKFTEDI